MSRVYEFLKKNRHFFQRYQDDIFGSKTFKEHPEKLKFLPERMRYEIIYRGYKNKIYYGQWSYFVYVMSSRGFLVREQKEIKVKKFSRLLCKWTILL